MIPGIELHHESLDGRGYPHGLKETNCPSTPHHRGRRYFRRADYNRPYQHAYDPKEALKSSTICPASALIQPPSQLLLQSTSAARFVYRVSLCQRLSGRARCASSRTGPAVSEIAAQTVAAVQATRV